MFRVYLLGKGAKMVAKKLKKGKRKASRSPAQKAASMRNIKKAQAARRKKNKR